MNDRSRPKAAPESAPTTASTSAMVALTGCPRGCGAFHEVPCLIGEPIDDNVDYSLSAIWVGNPPKLSDLRTTAVAA
jgi:hypothetical protein